MTKIFFKIVFYNLFILTFGLILIELIFGTWLKKSNYSNLLIPRQQTNIIDHFPYDHNTLGIYSRDQYGFRANIYDLDKVDVLILGGSTTEEREIDDSKIWTKIFEKNLSKEFNVLNAGIGGQTSYGHKSMFNLWFNNLTNLNPKYIISYLGINDALFLLESINENKILLNGRWLNSSNRDTLVNVANIDRTIQFFKNNSVFHSLYLIIRGNLISNKYKISYNNKPSKFNAHRVNSPKNIKKLDNKLIDLFKEYYFQNLRDILSHSKQYNSELILITQVVSEKHWLKNYLKIINSMTIDFCNKQKIKCIDLQNKITNLKELNFYDGIHTTPKGSQLIGEFIANEFNFFEFD